MSLYRSARRRIRRAVVNAINKAIGEAVRQNEPISLVTFFAMLYCFRHAAFDRLQRIMTAKKKSDCRQTIRVTRVSLLPSSVDNEPWNLN